MTAILLAVALVGQQPDSLIVSVELLESQERVVVTAILDADSTLRLPAEPVGRLLGVSFPAAWITVAALQAAYPTVRFAWSPRELRLYVLDDLRVLPASRRANQQLLARHQMAFGLPPRSAPFVSLAFDDRAALLDAGYSWRGRIAVGGRFDNGGAATWHVTAAPSSYLFVSYQDGFGIRPAVQGRLAAGPLWLAGGYTPGRPVDVAGLLRVGPAQVFASPAFGVLTIQAAAHVAVQLAQTWETKRTAARISVGPTYASPFSFPVTSLSPRR